MLQVDEETDLVGLFSRILEDVYFMFSAANVKSFFLIAICKRHGYILRPCCYCSSGCLYFCRLGHVSNEHVSNSHKTNPVI